VEVFSFAAFSSLSFFFKKKADCKTRVSERELKKTGERERRENGGKTEKNKKKRSGKHQRRILFALFLLLHSLSLSLSSLPLLDTGCLIRAFLMELQRQ
jgi:hypothetical protein